MKKVLAIILLLVMVISAFGLTACEFIQWPDNPDNPDNQDNPDNPDNGDGDDEKKTYVTYTDIEDLGSYIGCGINIIDAPAIYGSEVRTTYPIFARNELMKETFIKESTSSGSTFEYVSGFNMQEFMRDLSNSRSVTFGLSAAAKGKIKGIDMEASASFSNGLKSVFATSSSKVEKQYFLRVMAEKQSFNLVLQSEAGEARYKEMLTDEFKTDLYNSKVSPAELFEKYGTHLLLSIVMGGNIYLDYTMYSSDTSTTDEHYKEVVGEYQANAKAAFGNDYSASAGTNASYEDTFTYKATANEKNIEIEETVYGKGGDSNGIRDEKTFYANYSAWQKSVDENPALIGIRDEQSLYPLWKLIDTSDDMHKGTYTWVEDGQTKTGTRAEQLEAYFLKYGLESYNQLCTFYDTNTTHIKSAQDLSKIAEDPAGTYVLDNDINCGGKEWEPIKEFTGTIEGNGYKIYNFSIQQENDDFAGSAAIGFVGINKGTINNLTIGSYDYKQLPHTVQDDESEEIDAELAGRSVLYLIKYTENDDEKSNSLHVGGIAGINEEEGIINGCKVINANIYSKLNAKKYKLLGQKEYANLYQGGIAGTNYGKITNSKVHECHIEGKITATTDSYDRNKGWLGGVCGYSTNKIEHCSTAKCYLKLDVRGDGFITTVYPWATVGGIVAKQVNGDLNMCLSYDNTIDVYASEGGKTEPTITAGTIVGTLESCTPMGCCALYPTDSKPITIKTTYTKDNPTYTNNMRGDGKIEGCTAESDKSELHDDIKDLLPDETDN